MNYNYNNYDTAIDIMIIIIASYNLYFNYIKTFSDCTILKLASKY